MKTTWITLALAAFTLSIADAGNGLATGKPASPLSGDYLCQAGGGGQGNGNGNGQRARKRDGSGGNCDGGGTCDGSGNGQRARRGNGGN